MFGHKISKELFDQIKSAGTCFLDQDCGKALVSPDKGPNTVARCVSVDHEQVYEISDELRSQMNSERLPLVVFGPTLDASEAYVPDRFFENHPYVNRPFIHGIFDCYTLIRDYYRREFGKLLPSNNQRTYGWWNSGENLYIEGAPDYGFEQVNSIRKHDVILMKFTSMPSHAGIYMGEGNILHHVGGRFSCVEPLTSEYKRMIYGVYRQTNRTNG